MKETKSSERDRRWAREAHLVLAILVYEGCFLSGLREARMGSGGVMKVHKMERFL